MRVSLYIDDLIERIMENVDLQLNTKVKKFIEKDQLKKLKSQMDKSVSV